MLLVNNPVRLNDYNFGCKVVGMKMNLAERLKFARREAGLSQKKLGESVGISQAAIQKIETGLAQNSTKLIDIAGVLKVRPEWLSSGIEPMKDDGKSSGIVSKIEDTTGRIYRVDVLDIQASAGPGTFMVSDFVEVIHAIEFTSEYARSLFGTRSQEIVQVITVSGDSMAPTITSGDRVFVDISVRNFETDGVYVFVFGNTFHIKRLQMQGDRLAVLSDNPVYEKWYITDENQHKFYVMGKVLIHESIKYYKIG